METTIPEDVAIIDGFRAMDEQRLEEYRKAMGFAMSHDDIVMIQQYFKEDEDREPTLTELKVVDTYWSDHCRHTTFNTTLSNITFEDSRYGAMVKKAFDRYMENEGGRIR